MSSNGTARIVWGVILTAVFGLFSLRGLIIGFTLGFGLYGLPGVIGLLVGLALTGLSVALLVRGLNQRRVYLSGTHSTDQRSADLS